MSATLTEIQKLVAAGDVLVSSHGDEELANDRIALSAVLHGVAAAAVVEDYPTFAKGPCILVLQRDEQNNPIHVLWGLRKNTSRPAVLITAYRPDPNRWYNDFLSRRP